MRRYIAYLALGSAMMLAASAMIAPTMKKLDTDIAYSDGQTFYFKASHYEDESLNGNYGIIESGGELSFLSEEDVDNEGEYIISDIATTMRERLDTWGISEYEVLTQGYDTVAVTLRTPKDASEQYSYLKDYLAFSGQHYELDASNTSSDSSDEDGAYNHNDKWETLLDGQTARIEEIDMNSYSVPVVVVPIAEGDDNKDAFLKLLEYCADNTTEDEKDDEGNVTQEGKTCAVVLWANRVETDKYEDRSSNPNVNAKIIWEGTAVNDNAVYYASDDDKENKVNPALQLIPRSAATSGETYDPTKTKEAYEAAVYLRNKFNASAYEYKNSLGQDTRYSVSFTYSETTKATVEALVGYGNWGQENPNSTQTLWTMVITLVVMGLVLIAFERLLALHHLANVMVVGVSSTLLYIALGTQFNIATLIALGVVALVTLFGSLYQSRRMKDELYKGRTLKKANQEASKKAVLPIVDAGVITVIIGIFLYILGGDIANKAGVMLVIGGLLATAANLILTRLQFWLLSNDSYFPSHIQRQLGIAMDKIPNLANEEKQTFFGTYAERDFTKGKKVLSIAMSALVLAGIGFMVGFGIANNGDVYNDASYQDGNTVLRIDLRSDNNDNIYALAYNEAGRIYDEDAAKDSTADIFHQYKINGKTLAELTSSFTVSESPKVVYSTDAGSDTPTEYHWHFYQAVLNTKLAEDGNTILVYNPATESFEDAGYNTLTDLAAALVNAEDQNVIVSFKQVSTKTLTPYLWQIALGAGVGLAVAMVYMVLRYRPSRGLAISILVAGTSYLAVAFFAITRIATAPIAGLAMIPVTVIGLVMSLFTLAQEKNIFHDSREKEKNTLAFRSECLELAAKRESHTTIVFFLLAWLFAIVGFGLSPVAYCMPYLGLVIGFAFTLAAILVLLVPFTKLFAGLFSKIKIKPRKKKAKQGGQLLKKRNSAEPEESIFIGIND